MKNGIRTKLDLAIGPGYVMQGEIKEDGNFFEFEIKNIVRGDKKKVKYEYIAEKDIVLLRKEEKNV